MAKEKKLVKDVTLFTREVMMEDKLILPLDDAFKRGDLEPAMNFVSEGMMEKFEEAMLLTQMKDLPGEEIRHHVFRLICECYGLNQVLRAEETNRQRMIELNKRLDKANKTQGDN